MTLVYVKDIWPIIIIAILFSLMATAHRVLIPNKYSAFLQFKEEEDPKKTAQSTTIRILYLIIGTAVLSEIFRFSERQIAVGLFVSCFLNIWPAIMQHRLLKLKNTGTEWLLLLGYILFIFFSIFIEKITIYVMIPILKGEQQIYWLENQAISIIASLLFIAIPIPVEALLSKLTHVTVVQTIDTFREEIYILEKQFSVESPYIKNNQYVIDDSAKQNDIPVELLKTILKLEIFYRYRMYNRFIEFILCKFLKKIAIKKDISVGLAQIKISTASKVMRQRPEKFIASLIDDQTNISICGKYLRQLIEEYDFRMATETYHIQNSYTDVFDYIACKYLGGTSETKEKTILVYSALLRNELKNMPLIYLGSAGRREYNVVIWDDRDEKMNYHEYERVADQLKWYGVLKREIYVDGIKAEFELNCQEYQLIPVIENSTKEFGLKMKIL